MEALHGAMCEHLHLDQRDYTSQRGAFQFDLNIWAQEYNFIDGSVIELIHTPGRVRVKPYSVPAQIFPTTPVPTAIKRSRSPRCRRSKSPEPFSESELFGDTPHPEAASQLINSTCLVFS
jgi:hypothetical protein